MVKPCNRLISHKILIDTMATDGVPRDNPYDYWNSVVASVLSYGPMEIPKMAGNGQSVPEPGKSGLFRRSVGEMKGQLADWRTGIPNSTRGIHIVEFEDHYSVHVDRFDPGKDPVRHLLLDSPRTLLSLVATGLASIFLYSILGGRRRP